MSMATAALQPLENKLPKVIDARTHGVIDYCHAAFFLGMALFCRKRNPPAATAALATGAFLLAEAMLTDYPLGVKRILPFELHGKLDSAFSASSMLMPRVCGFAGTSAASLFNASGLFQGALVGMTDWDSERAREGAPAREEALLKDRAV